ncbi:TPA: YopX family protein [Staphylococcus aureus]|uniref:YopX family protein n=2 Tax=Staphylococcus TaxID=1279 RepID=UPI001F213C80|nr:YopX family protein [Staphylococcus aureus]
MERWGVSRMTLRFRAWDKLGKEMHKVSAIDFSSKGARIIRLAGVQSNGKENHKRWHSSVELMQYTGVKDVNGVEIFEGDIVKVNVLEGIGPNASIVFKYGMFGVENDMHGYGYDKGLYPLNLIINRHEVEVIGNIFESSHLLEVTE